MLLLVATHHLYAQRYCPIHVPVATHCLSVSLCVVQFTFPVVTHYLRVCLCLCELASSCFPVATHCLRVPLCPCRCFGVWTRSWHRGSISPLSTGSSLTPSTPRSASHALDHPYRGLNATLFVDISLLLLQRQLHLQLLAAQCCYLQILLRRQSNLEPFFCQLNDTASSLSLVVLQLMHLSGRHSSSDCLCVYICM